MESLSENGRIIYTQVLDLGKQQGMRVSWGRVGFSVGSFSNGSWVVVCYGYPPDTRFQFQIYTDFEMIERKTNIPREVIEALRKLALDTGLFVPIGKRSDISCRTERDLGESESETLIGWLEMVIEAIRDDGQLTVASNQPERSSALARVVRVPNGPT